MKKKLLIKLILLTGTLILPGIAAAQAPDKWIKTIEGSATKIGASIIIIGWVIAGILYLTSAGSPEKTGTAKKALVAAVIGTALIIIAVSAKTMVEFYIKP